MIIAHWVIALFLTQKVDNIYENSVQNKTHNNPGVTCSGSWAVDVDWDLFHKVQKCHNRVWKDPKNLQKVDKNICLMKRFESPSHESLVQAQRAPCQRVNIQVFKNQHDQPNNDEVKWSLIVVRAETEFHLVVGVNRTFGASFRKQAISHQTHNDNISVPRNSNLSVKSACSDVVQDKWHKIAKSEGVEAAPHGFP